MGKTSVFIFGILCLLFVSGCESYVKFEFGRFAIGLIVAPIVGLIFYLIIKASSKKRWILYDVSLFWTIADLMDQLAKREHP